MIRWTKRIIFSNNIRKRKKVMAAISERKATLGVYCIAFASHPENLFDIIDANELLFPHYLRTEICIVGLARGKEAALDLVQDMLMEVYKKTGDFDVRSYFT